MKKFFQKQIAALFLLTMLICNYGSVGDHVFDRFVAGQLLYGLRHPEKAKISKEYIEQHYQTLLHYTESCDWGYYFKVNEDVLGGRVGIIIRF